MDLVSEPEVVEAAIEVAAAVAEGVRDGVPPGEACCSAFKAFTRSKAQPRHVRPREGSVPQTGVPFMYHTGVHFAAMALRHTPTVLYKTVPGAENIPYPTSMFEVPDALIAVDKHKGTVKGSAVFKLNTEGAQHMSFNPDIINLFIQDPGLITDDTTIVGWTSMSANPRPPGTEHIRYQKIVFLKGPNLRAYIEAGAKTAPVVETMYYVLASESRESYVRRIAFNLPLTAAILNEPR